MKTMRRTISLALFCTTALSFGQSALADTPEPVALAKSKACFSCHEIKNSPAHAPALADVGRRYKGQKNAELLLADKIKYGTSTNPPMMGHWGANVMPPSDARVPVSDDEAKILAKWVLSLS